MNGLASQASINLKIRAPFVSILNALQTQSYIAATAMQRAVCEHDTKSVFLLASVWSEEFELNYAIRPSSSIDQLTSIQLELTLLLTCFIYIFTLFRGHSPFNEYRTSIHNVFHSRFVDSFTWHVKSLMISWRWPALWVKSLHGTEMFIAAWCWWSFSS